MRLLIFWIFIAMLIVITNLFIVPLVVSLALPAQQSFAAGVGYQTIMMFLIYIMAKVTA